MSLTSANNLNKSKIEATDGEIGKVGDLYFDDATWTVRYVVVDTGSWLRPGRRTLVSPHSIESHSVKEELIKLRLSKQSIENGPEVDADKPVSRRMEEKLALHYRWPPYWLAGTLGIGMIPEAAMSLEQAKRADEKTEAEEPSQDSSLRSVSEVSGYRIVASDGDIGKVSDFVLDDEAWSIRYVVVDTGNWLPGRKVIVSPRWAKDIDWTERHFTMELSKAQVEASPRLDSIDLIDRDYEERLHGHYGFRKYWEKI
jgi:sporulation protein YlmC with PRC-barrel domain